MRKQRIPVWRKDQKLQYLKSIHWECRCGVFGDVGYAIWDFQAVAKRILLQHNPISPYGSGWHEQSMDFEISEDLTEARLRHIQ